MKQPVLIVPPDTAPGFALAGVRVLSCPPEALGKTVHPLTGDKETGMIAVDERLLGPSGAEELARLEKDWPGLIIVLPAPGPEEAGGEDYAMRLINKAIGYQVRLGP